MTIVGALPVMAALVAGCATGARAASEASPMAWAELRNASGASVGSALLRQENGRVRIVVQASGLAPGRHGIHVHSVGQCEAPAFQSAGAHFNPHSKKHGLESPDGPHGGDLPDLEADANGRVEYVAITDRVTLSSGPTSIFDADGSALVIHQQPDDQRTDPSGNSGDRILCGQLVTGPTTGLLRP
jgi:Cu-Zn family superoxide dismutase